MKAAIRMVLAVIAILLLFAAASLVELWAAGGAFDDDVRAEFAWPPSWPAWAVSIVAIVMAGSALWPWGWAS